VNPSLSTYPRRVRPARAVILLSATAFLFLAGCSKSGDETAAANAASGPGGAPGAGGPGGAGAGDWAARFRGGAAEESVAVQIAAVTRGPISATLAFNSTLETESIVDLFPQIGGQVEALLVEEGDFVTAGSPLLKIDDREMRVDADEAKVDLEQQTANFTRTEELFRRGLVNQQEFENARHTLEQSRLRAERAQIRLEYTTVVAPFDGVISEREVQVGARVSNSSRLFSFVSLQDMVARVFVPGRYLPAVKADQTAVITSDFLPGENYTGWVKRISPIIDPQSGTFKVTVGVRDPGSTILPGLFVKVSIVTEERPNALLVPKRAVVYDGGEQFLFTVRDGRAARIKLEAGFETADTIEIRSGLTVGDPVIVLGQAGLKEGTPVKVVNAEVANLSAALPPAEGQGGERPNWRQGGGQGPGGQWQRPANGEGGQRQWQRPEGQGGPGQRPANANGEGGQRQWQRPAEGQAPAPATAESPAKTDADS